jgi:hypothetical protein
MKWNGPWASTLTPWVLPPFYERTGRQILGHHEP